MCVRDAEERQVRRRDAVVGWGVRSIRLHAVLIVSVFFFGYILLRCACVCAGLGSASLWPKVRC